MSNKYIFIVYAEKKKTLYGFSSEGEPKIKKMFVVFLSIPISTSSGKCQKKTEISAYNGKKKNISTFSSLIKTKMKENTLKLKIN